MGMCSQHQLQDLLIHQLTDSRPPHPHPSPIQCINNWHRDNGYTSSLELPDNTLNFIKKHPLMEDQVKPRLGRPLLVKKNTNFTHVVADRVPGLDGATYTVLFIGTGRCFRCAQGWEPGVAPQRPGSSFAYSHHLSRRWMAAEGCEPRALDPHGGGAAGV